MLLVEFSADGWESWGIQHRPAIPDRMPVLVDADLLFEDCGAWRPSVIVNKWLRQLPVSGAPAPNTWWSYARVLRAWLEFLPEAGIGLFDSRDRLRDALSAYSVVRLRGSLEQRLEVSSWNLHVTVLSMFYHWALGEGCCATVPFTYSITRRWDTGRLVEVEKNNARLRKPKPHSTIKYLDSDFIRLFRNALAGLQPDGSPDETFRGREVGRNAAMGGLALASGLRRQEFTCLLVYEVPPLPSRRTELPILFPLPRALTKGQKPRTTWIDYQTLADVHHYMALERNAAAANSGWMPTAKLGKPLHVEQPDWEGAHINGVRRSWQTLTPTERLRLISPEGQTCLLAVQSTGKPFIAWPSVFTRTSQRIREAFEPRFPIVSPHRLRHTFAMQTLERLVSDHYRQAAALVKDTGDDPGLALYLTKADPLMVLRDLLGHASVTTTQVYLRRLDVARIYRQAYEIAGLEAGLTLNETRMEASAEFSDGGD